LGRKRGKKSETRVKKRKGSGLSHNIIEPKGCSKRKSEVWESGVDYFQGGGPKSIKIFKEADSPKTEYRKNPSKKV